jgi:hypothetical protein
MKEGKYVLERLRVVKTVWEGRDDGEARGWVLGLCCVV